jgi:hypothetical protein
MITKSDSFAVNDFSDSTSNQAKLLEESLVIVKQQGLYMRKSLDSDLLYDALKYAATMLSELKTTLLLPKYYYELCISHTNKRHGDI